MRRRTKKAYYTSSASNDAMRRYQNAAGMYPRLSHEETVSLSSTFVSSRNALIDVEADKMIELLVPESVMNGELNKDVIDEHIDDIVTGVKQKISMLSSKSKSGTADDNSAPKDVLDRWKELLKSIESSGASEVMRIHSSAETVAGREDDIRRTGRAALQKIIDHNMQLAMSRVGKILHANVTARSVDVEDLIGAANVGLVLGARQYNPELGKRFSTYASYHIDGQLHSLVNGEHSGNDGTIIGSTHEQKQGALISEVMKTFGIIYGRRPSIYEIRSITGISVELIDKRIHTPSLRIDSMDAPVSDKNDNDGKTSALSDMVKSDKDTETELHSSRYDDLMTSLLTDIDALPVKQRIVLKLKVGIALNDEDKTNLVSIIDGINDEDDEESNEKKSANEDVNVNSKLQAMREYDNNGTLAPLKSRSIARLLCVRAKDVDSIIEDAVASLRNMTVLRGYNSDDALDYDEID